MTNNTIFSETQRFRQWWLWLLLLPVNIIVIFTVWYAVIHNDPKTGELSVAGIILLLCIGPALTVFFLLVPKLETRIDTEGIHVRFFPFHLSFRHFRWGDITHHEIRKYSPLGEYGGWGIRWGFGHGKAYNVSGNMGLQLRFADGSQLLIGTGKPGDLEEALRKLPAT